MIIKNFYTKTTVDIDYEEDDFTDQLNGIDVEFITTYEFIPKTLNLFLNGVRMYQDSNPQEYEIHSSNQKIILCKAPTDEDTLIVTYVRAD